MIDYKEAQIEFQAITSSTPATVYSVTSGKKLCVTGLWVNFNNSIGADSVCGIKDGSDNKLSVVVKASTSFSQFFDFSKRPMIFSDSVVAKTLSGGAGINASIMMVGYEL